MKRLRNLLALAAAALLAAGCAPQHMAKPSQDSERLAAILDLEDESQFVGTQRCLSTYAYDSVEILDDQHLLFQDQGKAWVNRLRTRCPQLRPHETLVFELNSSNLCELDKVATANRMFLWWTKGPSCPLGEFKEISQPQAQLLSEAF